MNILPKKRWHVRTKENIARVRRDEALAAEQAKIEQARIDKAESETRLNLLRTESRKKNSNDFKQDVNQIKSETITKSSKHINFFEELEQGGVDYKKTNKDFEKEKKEEQEKYEKQIGLLTYLGQGLQEATDKRWYNGLPKRVNDVEKNVEIKPNKKALEDPVQDIKRYLNIIALKRQSNELQTKSETSKSQHTNAFEKSRKRKISTDDSMVDLRSLKKQKCKLRKNSSSESEKSIKKQKKQKKQKKSKKHKHKKDKQSDDIEKLRAKRLKREMQEKLRAQELLKNEKVSDDLNPHPGFKQKYSSQFFPEFARQNCEKYNRS